jgi:hypothetical protein
MNNHFLPRSTIEKLKQLGKDPLSTIGILIQLQENEKIRYRLEFIKKFLNYKIKKYILKSNSDKSFDEFFVKEVELFADEHSIIIYVFSGCCYELPSRFLTKIKPWLIKNLKLKKLQNIYIHHIVTRKSPFEFIESEKADRETQDIYFLKVSKIEKWCLYACSYLASYRSKQKTSYKKTSSKSDRKSK